MTEYTRPRALKASQARTGDQVAYTVDGAPIIDPRDADNGPTVWRTVTWRMPGSLDALRLVWAGGSDEEFQAWDPIVVREAFTEKGTT